MFLTLTAKGCNGKPRHKIICNLGREEELLNKAVFDDLVKKFCRFAKNVLVFDKERDKVGKTYLFGGLLAVEAVWKKAGELCRRFCKTAV